VATEIRKAPQRVTRGQAAIDPAVQQHLLDAITARPPCRPAEPAPQLPGGLTARQAEVLSLIARGLSNTKIAGRLAVSGHIRRYLIPYLGRVTLAELTSADVMRLVLALSAQRTRYGEALTPATLQRIRATLRAALNAAIREGLIGENAARPRGAATPAASASGGLDRAPSGRLAAERRAARCRRLDYHAAGRVPPVRAR
jgi:hypothetical protein